MVPPFDAGLHSRPSLRRSATLRAQTRAAMLRAMSEPETPRALSFDANAPLPLTGERTIPGVPEENYWFQRHVAAYRYAAGIAAGRRTLDAGCGEGYGANILADTASEVVGVDVETAVVDRAAARYARARFETANLVALPYPDGAFQSVVSLQVIEHLQGPQDFVAECHRVLAPGGVLIISTPNRLTFSPDGMRNPFHTFELSPGELRETVGQRFSAVQILGTFHGPRLRAIETALRTPFPERLLGQPVHEWPGWLRAIVERVTEKDFRIGPRSPERSLDLIAVARRP